MTIRIRTKIIISFASIVILFSLLGLLAYYNRNLLFQGMLRLEDETKDLKLFSDIKLAMDMSVMPPNDFLITGDIREKERFENIVSDVEKGFNSLENLPGHNGYSPEILKDSREKFKILKGKADEIFSLKDPVGSRLGAKLMLEIDNLSNDIIVNDLEKLYILEQQDVGNEIASAQKLRRDVDLALLFGTVISVLAVFLVAVYLLRSIIGPILKFREGANIIGGGDLSHRIDIKDGLEVNILADEFNKMTQRLREANTDLEKKVEERTLALNETNGKLKELSITDGLTGVYNQRHFYTCFDEEMKRAGRYNHCFSLVMADIDYFKNYNDANGHLEGDNALRDIAACILKNVREQDIVARYGGEEFSIIMPETDKEGAIIAVERIRKAICEHGFANRESQPGGRLTMSFGVATYPADSNDRKELMKKADEALYRAKENGRNRVEG